MKINLPINTTKFEVYELNRSVVAPAKMSTAPVRTAFSAAHVVANPFGEANELNAIDWNQTLAFRRYLADLGLGIAEAMDTAQRGMGLNWPQALELIRLTRSELPDALVFNGAGTDHLEAGGSIDIDDVKSAYIEQIEAIQRYGGRIILMASRALAATADSAGAYQKVYREALAKCNHPVILHWLGDMFDPALKGYWGSQHFEDALTCCLEIIHENQAKIDGIKISLLDKDKEIQVRRLLPAGVKMYTGDDFNYPELIAGDDEGFSHALLGIFDPLAPLVASAINCLDKGNVSQFRRLLDPTVPLARRIFCAPTQYYKTGVVFLAWLNGFQDHFIMLNGAQSQRSLSYFVDCFKLSDQCGLLREPELARDRMQKLLHLYGY